MWVALVSDKATGKPLHVHTCKPWAEAWVAKQPRRPNMPKSESDFVITMIELDPHIESPGEVEAFWADMDRKIAKSFNGKKMSQMNSADWTAWEHHRGLT
jgi:hypothetical protein